MTLQKKQIEISSLNRVCAELPTKCALSNKIAKILTNQQDIRTDDKQESPDFVFKCKLPVEGECICGIEHFAAEHISDTHRQIPQSYVRIMHNTTIPNIIRTTQSLKPLDPIPQASLNGIGDYVQRLFNSTYADLMHSFNHSLQHHVQLISKYNQCLNQYADGLPTTLMFLIEIGMMPQGLWLFHNNTFTQWNKAQRVIFADMVKQIQALSQQGVKYVLLDIHDSIEPSKHYNAIIRTKHTRKDLLKHGFIICEYFGEDKNTLTKLNQIITAHNSSIQLRQNTDDTLTVQAQLSLMRSHDETEYHRNIIKALQAMERNEAFITTIAIYLQIMTMLLCFESVPQHPGLWKLSDKTYDTKIDEIVNQYTTINIENEST